ncbi:MAG: tRNA (adenosine(37)-N6)-threonylcarbamoyltransferase complex ATPase subunit type 1 TsaE [Gammaproteobacteria bacterium SHHR-1]|uniref:tRNA (adenosine(37)-N6)-threonylcarbamoyltransferase complex ATPase subunit type 1 TsaE n=1 Tax=Magnetovirga frankeli TaxID=947516 RepID=UPI0012936840|nr:tRNA (adenosine(37)-N6)-threonylcarbamoyltransferase complex ATPase subunit type 1 TsaE [gamma proteobacterium SS-5]
MSISEPSSIRLHTDLILQGAEAQEAFGQCLAAYLAPPLMIYLEGDLGAGKTTLARGILRGLGHQGAVVSPSYTLVETYRPGDFALHHLDLYRLGHAEELEYLGLEDLCDGSGVLLVEWPERGAGVLPAADVRIRIDHRKQARALGLLGESAVGRQIAEQVQAALMSEKLL